MTSIATAVVALIGAAGTVGISAGAAHADTSVALPITSFAHMVVADGHVFISEGAGSSSILVTDLDGADITTISGEQGANGLAVSADGNTVYAALGDADAISAIDATTLTESTRYSTGAASPFSVAATSGKLWFSYSGNGTAGIGSVDPSVSPATVTMGATGDSWLGVTLLATTPGRDGLLVAAAMDQSPAEVAVYDVSAGSVTRTARTHVMDAWFTSALHLTADGSDVLLAGSGPNNYFPVLRTTDLSLDGSYPASPWPTAVAVAPDGTVAGGLTPITQGDPDVKVFAAGGTTPLNTYATALPNTAKDGLAWAPDAGRLFEVAQNGTTFALNVLLAPKVTAATISLSGATSVAPGRPVDLSGKVTSALPLPAGTALHVTRTGPTDATPTPLPDVTTAADGSFAVADTAPAAEGGYSYAVSYDGDANHKPATTQFGMQIAKLITTLTLNAPASATRGSVLGLSGTVSGGPFTASETVQISKVDLANPNGVSVGQASVQADGSYSLTDTPAVGGAVTYRVSYAGDASRTAASAQVAVQVSRAAATLSVASNASVYNYGAQATVTVHLGTTYNGRTVSLYAQPVGLARALVKTGTVNASGNLVVPYVLTRSTTFSAQFAGDYRYAPASAAVAVRTYAAVVEAQSGYYTSYRSGSTLYRVYHHGARIAMGAAVAPNKAGQCARFQVQEYVSGSWRAVTTSTCLTLNGNSVAGALLTVTNGTGHLFRFAAEYVHSASDNSNLSTWGAWQYFAIRY